MRPRDFPLTSFFCQNPKDGAVQVQFTGLEVAAYQDKYKQIQFTAKAAGITLVE